MTTSLDADPYGVWIIRFKLRGSSDAAATLMNPDSLEENGRPGSTPMERGVIEPTRLCEEFQSRLLHISKQYGLPECDLLPGDEGSLLFLRK